MSTRSLLLSLIAAAALPISHVRGQDDENSDKNTEVKPAEVAEQGPEEKGPVARYITLTSPVNETIFTRVRNTLVKLQHQAEQEDRDAILILEIERGTNMFGQVRDLAKELTSSKYPRVLTVAWIPLSEDKKPLDGYTAILALACREIVMHPDAELGDIGRGQSIDEDEQLSVINMVEKRYNSKINGALAAGFVDRDRTVLKIKIETKEGDVAVTETSVVTNEEFRREQARDSAILAVETIKEQGDILTISGRRARAMDILVTQTADDRVELADLYGFDRKYLREDVTGSETPKARLIRIEGVIDPFLHEFVDREIRRAVNDGANLIIFEIDSPGGYLLDSEQLAETISLLDEKKHRTIAWVPETAMSGAAIIAMGCDEIYLAPDAKIGDAGPIEMRPGQPFERAPEKVLSPLRETMKLLAERKGRPPALLEAMADKDRLVFQVTHSQSGRVWYMSEEELELAGGEWQKGPLVPESREDNLLTLNGRRAHELQIAGEPVNDKSELKLRLGVPQDEVIPAAEQTWVDTLVSILKSPGATFLLFMVGLACIYLEVYTTTGFFGIGAALCFSIFFWSRFLGGTAGWLEIVLFLFGVALVALEIFVIPGFGIFGLTGGLAVIVSLVLASQTFVIPSTSDEMNQLAWTMGTMSSSFVCIVILGLTMSRFLPTLPGVRNLILAPPSAELAEGPTLDPTISGNVSPTAAMDFDQGLVGGQGVAFSTLRPAGKAQIAGQLIDVVSEGEFIDAGANVEVVEVTGNRVVVRSSGTVS